MFDTDLLEKIFMQPEMAEVPCIYQSIVIHTVERVLDEEEKNVDELYTDERGNTENARHE